VLTIVMYHYVRELRRSRFPEIKGLEVAAFREQLGYLRQHYELVSIAEVLAAYDEQKRTGRWPLPRNAALLTFDDGLVDHYTYVFPLLDEFNVPASFFPPAQVVIERRLLDVNRIHFTLASVADKTALAAELMSEIDAARSEFACEPAAKWYEKLAAASRFDAAEVIFIKRALQVALPAALRERIARKLFRKYVSADEHAFAEELYMSLEQIRCLARHGMYVGSHADDHRWLASLSPAEQAHEIDASLEFLRRVGTPLDSWVMCYPYGDWNETLLVELRRRGCALGLTTRVGLATAAEDPLLLPRLDTNDLPKSAHAGANEWTRQVAA
jgi:peptidoglycan/xylan/chitin deacetylase (PgdA/CDA1 family)